MCHQNVHFPDEKIVAQGYTVKRGNQHLNLGEECQSQGLDPEYAGLLCYPQTGDFSPE